MSDPQIAALRAQLANFPRSDDYQQMRKDFDALGLGFGRAVPGRRSRSAAGGLVRGLSRRPDPR